MCNQYEPSISWASIAGFVISLFAVAISVISLYLAYWRKPKVSSIIPDTIIIEINDGKMCFVTRNILLANRRNLSATLDDIWLELNDGSVKRVAKFNKEKLIEIGTTKFSTIPPNATYSNSSIFNLPPHSSRLSEMWFNIENLNPQILSKGTYKLFLSTNVLDKNNNEKLWRLEFTILEDLNIKDSAIGINLRKFSKRGILFEIRKNAH
jgi:hypothetical protein